MKRQKTSKSVKSSSRKVNIKFDFKDNTIFQKDTIYEGNPFIIKGIIDFTKPDIMLEERK